ncbi:MAG: DUF2007 domain-containing protein [Anaerolineae bacterium]|nr:DUF2007 domain-containing protein [Anaerolineae bacterium]
MKHKDSKNDLVIVHQVQGQLRAAVIRSALESAGIPVMLRFESLGATLGLTIDGIGRVDILVPPEWAAEARDLLDVDASVVDEKHPEVDD